MAQQYDAVLILAFGGPEKPEEVLPFIEGIVRGRNVPRKRILEVARHYEHVGGRSPNNDQCRRLVSALEVELATHGPKLPVYWGNRHWRPYVADTIRRMADDRISHAAAFFPSPYSSYSTCRQYLETIDQARAAVGDCAPKVDKLRGYFNHPGFIETLVERAGDAIERVPPERRANAGLIFTAHSLPVAMASQCDYERQLAEAARLVGLGLNRSDWSIAYQSRSGPPTEPWLEPDICCFLRQLKQQHPAIADVAVVPVDFIWDHMEVVYDLDVEVRRLCDELGINMIRAVTAGTHRRFVAMIRQLVVERAGDPSGRPALGRLGPAPDVCSVDCCPAPRRLV